MITYLVNYLFIQLFIQGMRVLPSIIKMKPVHIEEDTEFLIYTWPFLMYTHKSHEKELTFNFANILLIHVKPIGNPLIFLTIEIKKGCLLIKTIGITFTLNLRTPFKPTFSTS